jgi:uncharacterized membrane-anchored protein YjiN (DUF445 family)
MLAGRHPLAGRALSDQLTALISEVVKSWNAQEVTRKIEAEIERELRYDRINGTPVGGMAGVLLHAAAFIIAR